MDASFTGVDFQNQIVEDTTFNFLNYLYYYNGGGVAVGDINNDGLDDLFFTSNQNENKLYLNKGEFRFEDITASAGMVHVDSSWSTGAAMADVNGDGWMDIYVSNVNYLSRKGKNQLYINNGDGTFTEKGEEYGLDFEGYSVQAAFFDYDKDGDLDMFLLNHSVHSVYSYQPIDSRRETDLKSGDRLFRNDGNRFTDVSQEAGIYSSALGFGLGVNISDINLDGWPDIYVGNDFHEDDYLYINNGDGTFRDELREAVRHTSQFTMSVDIADINNDGKPDIATTDMLPGEEQILKMSGGGDTYQVEAIKRRFGYYPQYSRNVLQLNVGTTEENIPVFSDIGYLAGVEATDWSWTGLLTDLDNDGYRDFYVANGIYRRPNDLDYIKYISTQEVQESLQNGIDPENLKLIQKMPQLKIPNAVFRNSGDLSFTDESQSWGLDDPSYSNGAVYSDLDNDGDLDLIVNNVNQPAFLYRNNTILDGESANYLQLKLKGEGKNTSGIGAKVWVYAGDNTWLLEQSPVRGFQSSVSHRLHFGLGEVRHIDSLKIVWNDNRYQSLTNVEVNQILELAQSEASGEYQYPAAKGNGPTVFTEITKEAGVNFTHKENSFVDFDYEPLIPHYLSTQGPPLAVADVNGDGLEDFFVGGGPGQSGKIWIQDRFGSFTESRQPALERDKIAEDTDAVFFNANGDEHPDLMVATGGGQAIGEMEELLDRLYINDGKGNFTRYTRMPLSFSNTGAISPGDFDGDGDMDLFIGGRSIPTVYGLTPRSFLLENAGEQGFKDVTDEVAPQLRRVGMVTGAVWLDHDNDGDEDLILAGEWMPITVFENQSSQGSIKMIHATRKAGLEFTNGWWNSLEVADLNGDGLDDLVAGNLGLNSYLKASKEKPLELHLNDFNDDNRLDPVITLYKGQKSYPLPTRDELFEQFNELKKKYTSYKDFGAQTLSDIFTRDQLDSVFVKKAYTFETSYFLNQGDGTFERRALPKEAQFSPVFALLAGDFNRDQVTDLYCAGNFYGVRPSLGRYDASYGALLLGNKNNIFKTAELDRIGIKLKGEVRDMQLIQLADGNKAVLISRNNADLLILKNYYSMD